MTLEHGESCVAPPFPGNHCALPEEERPLLHRSVDETAPTPADGNPIIIISCISCTTLIGSLLSGVVTVAIPQIASDLNLDANVELWPISMYSLSSGCTLLISGSIADVVGSKEIFLLGCFLQTIFSMACGLSVTGTQLIIFRIFSGLATSFCLPTAVSLVSENFPPGRMKNIAFAAMGGGQPIGYGVGLTIGGAFADTAGWKWGFHAVAIVNAVLFLLASWQLPPKPKNAPPVSWKRLAFDIDWVGAIGISSSLGMLSYVLADITDDASRIESSTNIVLLSVSTILFLSFFFWVDRQERRGLPALISNSLWRNGAFSSVCTNVFLILGTFTAFQQVTNFFFQEVQGISAFQTAWRFLPVTLSGTLTSIVTGAILHRARADWIINLTTMVSCLSPLLMALVDPAWSYWACAFPAVFLSPVEADALFTVSNIIITSIFPADMQGLAGGVFNTVSQFGKAVGLALVALISNLVTVNSDFDDKESPEALMLGYRWAFWFLVLVNIISLVVSAWGLRKVGNIGRERKQRA